MTKAQRLAGFSPDSLAPAQRALYNAIAGGLRASGPQHFPLLDADGCLRGPFTPCS
jgi:hypothetical protein